MRPTFDRVSVLEGDVDLEAPLATLVQGLPAGAHNRDAPSPAPPRLGTGWAEALLAPAGLPPAPAPVRPM